MNKTEKIKKCLKKTCQTANAHGIPKIFNSDRAIIKTLWIICLLICASVCIWMLIQTVDSFLEHTVVTNIDIKPEMPSPFPSIKICSLIPTLRNYTLKERIISCKFNGIYDCTNDFVLYFDYYIHQMCLKFNTNASKGFFTNKSGAGNGLILNIFDGLFNETRNNSFTQFFTNGLKIFISNSSIEPHLEEAFLAAPGFSTHFAIHKIISSRLTQPYNDCIDTLNTFSSFDSTLYTEIINSNHSYRQSDCLDFAFIRTFSPNVSFETSYKFIYNLLNTNSSLLKSNLSSIDSLNSQFFKFYNNISSNEKLMSQCPFECNSLSYETTIFQGDYPSNNEYLNLLKNTPLLLNFPNGNLTSLNEFKQSLYSICIYFKQLSYTQISQNPQISLWSLTSNIGGLFGLFLGLSFLSIIDFCEAFIEIAFILLEKKIRPA